MTRKMTCTAKICKQIQVPKLRVTEAKIPVLLGSYFISSPGNTTWGDKWPVHCSWILWTPLLTPLCITLSGRG